MSCLYKLSSVAFCTPANSLLVSDSLLGCQMFLYLTPPHTHTDTHSPSFRSVFVIDQFMCLCFSWIENVCLPCFCIVFVIVHAKALWPGPVHPLTAVYCGSVFSPASHLNVKPPPGGSHLSFGDMNTLSNP